MNKCEFIGKIKKNEEKTNISKVEFRIPKTVYILESKYYELYTIPHSQLLKHRSKDATRKTSYRQMVYPIARTNRGFSKAISRNNLLPFYSSLRIMIIILFCGYLLMISPDFIVKCMEALKRS